MTMKVKDFLTDKNWIKNFLSIDKYGFSVSPDSISACRFCLLGALLNVYGPVEACNILPKIEEHLNMDVEDWNDDPNRTYEDIHNLCVELDL